MHRLWQASMATFLVATLLAGAAVSAFADDGSPSYFVCTGQTISALAAEGITPAAIVRQYPSFFHDEGDVIRLIAGYCQAGFSAQTLTMQIMNRYMQNLPILPGAPDVMP
jgi:hypothetical protein